jgi:hypothetical protein
MEDEVHSKSKIGLFENQENPSTPLLCSDLIMEIKATGYGDNQKDIEDIGFDFGTFHLQEATFDVSFERREYIGLGYAIPIDRPVRYPIIVNSTISALVSTSKTGELRNIFNKDHKYDVTIKARNRQVACSGEVEPYTVLQYDLVQSNVDSIDFSNQVNDRAFLGMSFVTDVADNVSGKGLFISGKITETGTAFSGFNF